MDFDSIVREKISQLDIGPLNDIINSSDIPDNLKSNLDISTIVSHMLTGDGVFDINSLKTCLSQIFLADIKSIVALALELIAVGIISGLLKNMDSSFGNETVSKSSSLICGCVSIGICLTAFSSVYTACISTVKYMTLTMEAILPVLFALLLSMGGMTTANVMNGVILGAVTAFSSIVRNAVLPALFFSTVFTLGNSLSNQDYIKKLASFMRSAALFIIGLCITAFTGLTAIQGMMTSSADGLLMKTAKYSVDNFMPVVGGFAADSLEMVITCSNIIKNGVGIAGIIMITFLLISPLIKVAVITLMFKLVAIVTEPMGDRTISECMNELGNTSVSLGAALFLSALMFYIFLAVLIKITIV